MNLLMRLKKTNGDNYIIKFNLSILMSPINAITQ